MIKAVIFDVGGTLLGATDLLENIVAGSASPESHDAIYNQVGHEFFRQIADCRNGSMFKRVVEIVADSIEAVNRENHNCLDSVNAAQVYWKTFVTDAVIVNAADIVLERLYARHVELFIASDADAELIYAQFDHHQWTKYISKFFISSEVKAYKPSDLFVTVLNDAIGVYEKEEVIFVGDSDVDIETGKKLGVKTALISQNNERRYNEDYSFRSLLELLDL